MKLIKSSLLVKLVILILVVYATVTLVKLQSRISDKKAEADALTSSITTAEQENGRLQDAIDKLDTPEGVENVARDKLDMAAEGEIIFYDVSDKALRRIFCRIARESPVWKLSDHQNQTWGIKRNIWSSLQLERS